MAVTWSYPVDAAVGKPERIPHPKIIPAADANDAMREALELMIAHSGEIICGCKQCDEYLTVREILLRKFY